MTKLCRLLGNLQIEPLNNQWYVCLPMLAPVPNALVLTYSQIPIMQSYIEFPEHHLHLSKELSMKGGNFVNYPINRVEKVKELICDIEKDNFDIINFSLSLKKFDKYLHSTANGFSLESEYEKLPLPLKGYVELVYDMHNNVSIKFIEALLYKSKYFSKKSQSISCSLVSSDERPFVLSTPRLIDDEQVQIKFPFDSPYYDDLCSMREYPRDFDEIIAKLQIPEDKKKLFESFVYFTDIPNLREEYISSDIRIRYFGHACLLIEYKGISILTDPFISYEYDTEIPRYTFSDLPPSIDFVLISHAHLDHIVLETLLQIRYKVKNIVVPKNAGAIYADPSLKLLLKNLGFKSVIEVDALDELSLPQNINIVVLPFLGEHHDLNIATKAAYILIIENKKVFIAADSSNLDCTLYEHIKNIYGEIDILLLGMECKGAPLSWFYGPLMTTSLEYDKDRSRLGSGSDYQKAIRMVNTLNPSSVYIYAMGMEPWNTYVLGLNYDKNSIQLLESDKLMERCNNQGIYAERLFCKKEFFLNCL